MRTITKIKAGLGAGLFAFIAFLWAFGGFVGAVIAASQDSLVNVVLAIFIPGYGAVYTVIALLRWIF